MAQFGIYILFNLVLLCDSVGALNITETNVGDYVTHFKKQLESHIDNVLAFNAIKGMLESHDKELHQVKVNGSELFHDIFEKVGLRYNDLVLSTNLLKSSLEKDAATLPSNGGPPPNPNSGRRRRYIPNHWNGEYINNLKIQTINNNEVIRDDNTNIAKRVDTDSRVLYNDQEQARPRQTAFKRGTNINPFHQRSAEGGDIIPGPPLPTNAPSGFGPAVSSPGGPPLLPGGSVSIGPPKPGGGEPLIPGSLLHSCCDVAYFRDSTYNGRLRENVKEEVCGDVRDTDQIFVDQMKHNYNTYKAVTWQYYVEKEHGAYMQYPSNHRHCDINAPSPTLQTSFSRVAWLVEKFHMERKNIVLLIDNTGMSGHQSIVHAASEVLTTLTGSDKVNIVATPSTQGFTETVPGCVNTLMEAVPASIADLQKFIKELLPVPGGHFNLKDGLQKVYQLFEEEKEEVGFAERSNLVLILVDGASPMSNTTSLLQMIANYQQKLDHSIQHFVYAAGDAQSKDLLDLLAQIADQNNMKLPISSNITVQPWTGISNSSVGKEGLLDVVEDYSLYSNVVERYFERLPPKIDKELTTFLTKTQDDDAFPVNVDTEHLPGITLTVATPVYNKYKNETTGLVAVEGTLATIFSEIVNFDLGEKSYAYLVDATHGHVVLHPKLEDPGKYAEIFPKLETVEGDLIDEQQDKIMAASVDQMSSFDTQITGVHPDIDGELVSSLSMTKETATVYYRRLRGTKLIMVLVHFLFDESEYRTIGDSVQSDLHGVYHRLDLLFGSPEKNVPGKDEVCHMEGGHFLSFKQSVIKLAPTVFTDVELYKYSQEGVNSVTKLNSFVTMGTSTDLINADKADMILHTLRSTDDLDSQWANHYREIIVRFYGSATGVFRMYPGAPMLNTFDHRQTNWYKRSIAFPDSTMYHLGKLSFIDRHDVIIISKAVTSTTHGRVLGVVGMTVTPRVFTSQLSHAVTECFDTDKQCHIVDTTGNLLDSVSGKQDGHLLKKYAWLTKKLAGLGNIKSDWCTSFSEGYHKMTLTLREAVTSDLKTRDTCKQFAIQNIPGTNLFLLVMGNRQTLGCDNSNVEHCTSCSTTLKDSPTDLPVCENCLSNTTSTTCQCQCTCDTDLDQCDWQFQPHIANFPTKSCYSPPVSSTQFRPDSPGPMHNLERCPIPCAAIENMDICEELSHCKASDDIYPACIWRDEDELEHLNITRYFPTSSPPTPPHPPDITLPSGNSISTSTGPPVPPQQTSIKPEYISTSAGQTIPSTASSHGSLLTSLTPSTKVPLGPTETITPSSKITPNSPSATKVSSSATTTESIVKTSSLAPTASVSKTGTPAASATHTGQPTASVSNTGRHTASVTNTGKSTFPTTPKHKPTDKTGASAAKTGDDKDSSMSPGAIVALVIGLLVLVVIVAFVVVKIYGKKFRRPGADESSSKYRTGNSMFNSALFQRHTDQVTVNTDTPYQELQ